VATYSPATNDLVVVFVALGGAVTGLQVQDNLGNYLAPGPTGASTPYQAAGTGYLYSFWGLAAAGANAYTATWGTAQDSAIVLGEYSSVGSIDFTLTVSHASGTSTTPAITPTSTQANSIFVAGMMDNSSDGFTAIGGSNLRETNLAGSVALALVDSNTIALNTADTVQATIAGSDAWGVLVLELKPFAGAPYDAVTNPTGPTAGPAGLNPIINGTQLIKSPNPGSGPIPNAGVPYANTPGFTPPLQGQLFPTGVE